MAWKRGLFGVSGAPPPSFHRKQPPSWPMGKGTALSPDLFSDRAAEAGNMVTERHQKQPQMRGIGSNEAVSRIDTRPSIVRLGMRRGIRRSNGAIPVALCGQVL